MLSDAQRTMLVELSAQLHTEFFQHPSRELRIKGTRMWR